jgi:catechol 2,3-dioxygenase-like lactoylglutathione lyase family enzyme
VRRPRPRAPATSHVSRRRRGGLWLASSASASDPKEIQMRIANAQLWVHDQDEALAFYTQKLGMEVRADVTLPEMGNFRWLTVGPAGQPDVSIVLMAIPGVPVLDATTADQVRDLMAKGFAGTVFLTTEDCRASYEELKGRGVEFTEPPEERPYGIDSGFRDPSGNSIRLTQVREMATA